MLRQWLRMLFLLLPALHAVSCEYGHLADVGIVAGMLLSSTACRSGFMQALVLSAACSLC